MEASELRVNQYYLNESGKVEKFEMKLIQVDFIEDWQPIPLTEEWLLRFGFKNLNNNPYWLSLIHNGTGIHIGTNSNVELQFFLGDGTVKTKLKLNYVHQLQNLFFALTGEELTIKEV